MQAWIWLVMGIVVGAVTGAGVTVWRARRGGGGASIEALKRENEKFRDEVTEHFVETARLINQMTDSYKAVFDHLSQGADKLVDDKALAERMPRVSDQEVRLRHLGAPESGGKPGGSANAKPGAATGGKGSGPAANADGNRDPLKSNRPGGASKPSGTSSEKPGKR